MWSPPGLVATTFLTSLLLFQPAASLGPVPRELDSLGIFRDPDPLEANGEAPSTINSALHPLPPWDTEGSWTKRSLGDLTLLDPTESEEFLWGGARRSNRAPFFNMTMYTDERERIISMEKFTHMLEHVECGEEMVLRFQDKASFEYAIRAWNWVNEDETHSFIMIANHADCAKEERRAYYIIDADYDEEKNTAYLYGEEKKLRDVAHTFDVEFGHVDLPDEEVSELSRRWPWDTDYKEGGFHINIEDVYSGPIVDLDNEITGTHNLECISCGLTGGLTVRARIGFTFKIPHSITFGFDAPNLGGHVRMKLEVHSFAPLYAYYIDSLIPKNFEFKTPLGVIAAFVKPQFGVAIGGATGNFSFETGAGLKYPSDATAEITIDDPTDILDPDVTQNNWGIEAEHYGMDFKGHLESFSGSFFIQIYVGLPDIDGISLFAGLTGKLINIDVIWENNCPEEKGGNTKDSISIAFSNIVGAVLGTGPAYGVSLSMPNPFEKRSEVPDAPGKRSEGSNSLEKRLPKWPVWLPGGALTWTFAKKVWAQPSFCIDNIFTKREVPKLEKEKIPHVRRGTGFFSH